MLIKILKVVFVTFNIMYVKLNSDDYLFFYVHFKMTLIFLKLTMINVHLNIFFVILFILNWLSNLFKTILFVSFIITILFNAIFY